MTKPLPPSLLPMVVNQTPFFSSGHNTPPPRVEDLLGKEKGHSWGFWLTAVGGTLYALSEIFSPSLGKQIKADYVNKAANGIVAYEVAQGEPHILPTSFKIGGDSFAVLPKEEQASFNRLVYTENQQAREQQWAQTLSEIADHSGHLPEISVKASPDDQQAEYIISSPSLLGQVGFWCVKAVEKVRKVTTSPIGDFFKRPATTLPEPPLKEAPKDKGTYVGPAGKHSPVLLAHHL